MFRKFDEEDKEAVKEYLKKEELDWSEHLDTTELDAVEEDKYFEEIASNGIRESSKGFFMEITCQVKSHNDVSEKIQEILNCFDQFPIEVHTDFWFFCHSKTR